MVLVVHPRTVDLDDPALRESSEHVKCHGGGCPTTEKAPTAAFSTSEEGRTQTNEPFHEEEDATEASFETDDSSYELDAATAKANLKALLAKHNRSSKHPEVAKALEDLTAYNPTEDAALSSCLEGLYVSLTRPEFPGRIKQGPENEHVDQYTLGRMSFNIFQPKDLVCTIVRSTNTLKSVRKEDDSEGLTYTYFLVTEMIVHTPKGDFPASLQMDAYCSSANQPKNRLGVTFVGGTMIPALEVRSDSTKLALWKEVFAGAYAKAEAERSYVSMFMHYVFKWMFQLSTPTDEDAAKSEDCAVRFEMKRCPHGYIDVLYMDDDLRVTRGNRGTIVVVERTKE